MRSRGWGKAWVILPHDGAHGNKVFATSYESAIREAGFDVLVIPNQGAGAASARIETARRHFPRIFFNEETTEGGRDAIGWYHEKKSNDDRNIGLGPNHDWSSHGADSFGLMCIHYDQPDGAPPRPERYRGRRSSSGADHGRAYNSRGRASVYRGCLGLLASARGTATQIGTGAPPLSFTNITGQGPACVGVGG
jgi:phage terminase large subunit